MKKLINDPAQVVDQMLDGLVLTYPGLRRLAGRMVIVRADASSVRDAQVAVLSGGGSGHEPAHAGYVGLGMLSAAVAGHVFTSPSVDEVLDAIRAAAGPPGALLIVKNYQGDGLNFGLAAELARAEGIPVETVVVADDVALDPETPARGLAGTILVHKVAGAAAQAGLPLAEVAAEARAAAEAVRTMGVALTPCIVPAAGAPSFDLGPNEMELGLGIHGEPGAQRVGILAADEVVDRLLEPIRARGGFGTGSRAVLLVNNLGGTPPMELAIVARHATEALEGAGVRLERVYCGTFLSSLEMAGVSLSVMHVDEARLARLDAPTLAPAWPNASAQPHVSHPEPVRLDPKFTDLTPVPGGSHTETGRRLGVGMKAVAHAWVDQAEHLNELDRAVGDGDLGVSLSRGSEAVLKALPTLPLDDAPVTLEVVSQLLRESLGGTSGPLLAAGAMRASMRLRQAPGQWASALEAAVTAIRELGGAAPGDRTLLDALLPASMALSGALQDGRSESAALRAAMEAAADGVKRTAAMLPRRGRSSYLGDRALGHPDPGAEAIAVAFGALFRAIG